MTSNQSLSNRKRFREPEARSTLLPEPDAEELKGKVVSLGAEGPEHKEAGERGIRTPERELSEVNSLAAAG